MQDKGQIIVPRQFLKAMNMGVAECKQEECKKGSTVQIYNFTDPESDDNRTGSIIKVITESKRKSEEWKSEIDNKLAIRRSIDPKIIPQIIDYCIEKKEENISILSLAENLGISFPNIIKEKSLISKNYFSWLLISAQELGKLYKEGMLIKNIGPELFYVNNQNITILDIDDFINNKNWTMDINKMKSNSDWRHRRVLKPFPVPSCLTQEGLFAKYQVYMWACSFLYLSLGDNIIEQLSVEFLINNDIYIFGTERLEKIIEKEVIPVYKAKIALVLSVCITNYPNLCPSFDELGEIISKLKSSSYEELAHLLKSRCGNCGVKIKEKGLISTCTKVYVCEDCVQNKKCSMCAKPHIFTVDKAEKKIDLSSIIAMTIIEKEHNIEYIVTEEGTTIGRKKNDNKICNQHIIKL